MAERELASQAQGTDRPQTAEPGDNAERSEDMGSLKPGTGRRHKRRDRGGGWPGRDGKIGADPANGYAHGSIGTPEPDGAMERSGAA